MGPSWAFLQGNSRLRPGVARCLRVGQFGPDIVRVVVELNAPVGYEAFAREDEPGVALLLNHAVDSLSWRDTDVGGNCSSPYPPTLLMRYGDWWSRIGW